MDPIGPIRFGPHARMRALERKLDPAWIERILAAPGWTAPDPSWPGRVRVFGHVPELGQILRVVVEPADARWEVVTIFPDRHAAKRRSR